MRPSETKVAAERARLLIEQAEALGEPPEDPLLLFSVLYSFWVANYVAFKGDVARGLAEQFLALAEKQETTAPLMIGHRIMGISSLINGRISEGREHFDQALALYDPAERVTDQVDEIERMSRLRRFLPPQVAHLIVASGTEKQLESHRREITALFCDLRGFTGFSESADPEDVMTVLREYHEALGASIIKYSGTLERYAGDGVMVVFNDPVPVENSALAGSAHGARNARRYRDLDRNVASVGARHWFRDRHCARLRYTGHHRLRGQVRLCRHRDRIQCCLSAMR